MKKEEALPKPKMLNHQNKNKNIDKLKMEKKVE